MKKLETSLWPTVFWKVLTKVWNKTWDGEINLAKIEVKFADLQKSKQGVENTRSRAAEKIEEQISRAVKVSYFYQKTYIYYIEN